MICDTDKLLGTQFGKIMRFNREEMGNSCRALGNVQTKIGNYCFGKNVRNFKNNKTI